MMHGCKKSGPFCCGQNKLKSCRLKGAIRVFLCLLLLGSWSVSDAIRSSGLENAINAVWGVKTLRRRFVFCQTVRISR